MNLKEIVGFVLKASIMLTVFGFGLESTRGDLLYLLRRPGLLVRSLTAMFLIMPLFAIAMTRIGHFIPGVVIAFIALSISPVPPLLPKKMTKGGGLAPYGLGLMVTAGLLAIVYIPIASYLIGKFFHRPLGITPLAVAKIVITSILVPLALGVLIRTIAPVFSKRAAGTLLRVANIVFLLAVACVLIFAWRAAWGLVGNGTVFVFIVFVIVGLLVGHSLGGPDPEARVVLALSTACRHPALALAIAAVNFPDEHHVLGAVLLYLILNVVLTIPYVAWQRKIIQAHPSALPS